MSAAILCCIAAAAGSAYAQVKIPGPAIINVVAGQNAMRGYSGDGGQATGAELNEPWGVAVDAAGNIYIADAVNNRIRKVTASTGVISTVAGDGTAGFSGDGGAATNAELNEPWGVAVDAAGNIYILDLSNYRIRKVTAATGIISTVAGNGTKGFSGDGGAATAAKIDPRGIATDSAGDIYIADTNNDRVRKVTASTGIITTVAGNGTYGYSGDGGPATSAELYYPYGVAVDAAGNFYIADMQNDRIRKVTTSSGIISTVAGDGTLGYSGDGGLAKNAELNQPQAVAVDSAGNIYIADTNNFRIRKVFSATGFIITVAGGGGAAYYLNSYSGGPADSAGMASPEGVAVDSAGNIYIDDAEDSITLAVGASTFSNLDDVKLYGGWQYPACYGPNPPPNGPQCAGGTATATNVSQTNGISSPSIDGKSMEISFTGPQQTQTYDTTNVLWPYKVGANDKLTHMLGTFSVYVPSLSLVWALEYDQFQFAGGEKYMYGSQCVINGNWEIWNQSTQHWETPSPVVPCNLTAGAWHTIQWQTHRVPGDTSCSGSPCLYYDLLTIDGTSYGPFTSYPAGPTTWDNMGIQFQIDENYLGGVVKEYLDEVSLTIY